MVIVESGAFGESRRELVLPVSLYSCRKQPPGSVSDRMAIYIMQSDTDGIGQEAPAIICTNFEECSCLRSDVFLLKPGNRVIQWQFSNKRLKLFWSR